MASAAAVSRAAYLERYTKPAHTERTSHKRKRQKATDNLRIVDDTATSWPSSSSSHSSHSHDTSASFNRTIDSGRVRQRREADEEEEADNEAARIRIDRADGSGWVEIAPQQPTLTHHNGTKKREQPDLSPPRKQTRETETTATLAPDLSPPRRRTRHDSPDLSPPRRLPASTAPLPTSSADRDLSPPRRRVRHDSVSPQRTSDIASPLPPPVASHDGDLSPPRVKRERPHNDTSAAADLSPPRRPAATTGLLAASQFAAQSRQAEQQRIASLPAIDSTQQQPAVVIRDKQGRRLTADELAAQQTRDRESSQPAPMEWASGLAQRTERERRQRDEAVEASKSMARGRDDQRWNDERRQQTREDDPLHHISKSSSSRRPAASEDRERHQQERERRRERKEEKKAAKREAKHNRRIARRLERGETVDFEHEEQQREAKEKKRADKKKRQQRSSDAAVVSAGVSGVSGVSGVGGEVRPMYGGGGGWLNRYGVLPGYRWDGVDRSNGFESRWFAAKAKREMTKQAAYKWSSEDM